MHDLDFEHVHEVLEGMNDEDHPLWATDHIALTSAGIDIGSATAQVLFSRLHLRRMGQDLSSRYVVVSREQLYQSPIYFTPYRDEIDEESGMPLIDSQALAEWIQNAYREAGLTPETVDTGAVILTGEAIRRPNAQAIANLLADEGGQFVCATAGHHMESLLAAHGSGAARLAHDANARILNIDIGGGTTKLAIIDRGNIKATAAIHIGGRLAAVDDASRIIRLEPQGALLAKRLGFDWQIGAALPLEQRRAVAEWMAGAVARLILHPDDPDCKDLWVTPPLGSLEGVEAVTFSGGVGEYIYDANAQDLGDLGIFLGHAMAESAKQFPWPVWETRERIRATVVGASQYSVQVSGNTIYVSHPEVLPLRNIPAIRPHLHLGETVDPHTVAHAIAHHLEAFDLDPEATPLVLAVPWHGNPSYGRVSALAKGVLDGLKAGVAAGHPICLVLDHDIARLLGTLMHEEFHLQNPVVVIDGVMLRDFDFVDIGRVMEGSGTVPITIKSLVFQL